MSGMVFCVTRQKMKNKTIYLFDTNKNWTTDWRQLEAMVARELDDKTQTANELRKILDFVGGTLYSASGPQILECDIASTKEKRTALFVNDDMVRVLERFVRHDATQEEVYQQLTKYRN